MVGKKLSAKAQRAMDTLQEGRRKSQRLHGLIEQFCSAKVGQDAMAQSIARAGTDVGRVFMNAGLGVLADSANQIAMAVKRGGHTPSKYRQLREFMGSLAAGIDRYEKNVLDADAMEQREGAADH